MKIICKTRVEKDEILDKQKLITLLLKNRNIQNLSEFLSPSLPTEITLSSLGFAKESKQLMKILEAIRTENKMIVVYTDYDADGITGGTILWETLHLLGFRVMPYVPHRHNEGYGFSKKGIDTVKKTFDPSLIISVDHGISGRQQIAYAASLGIPIVVTDHHMKPEKIPDKAMLIFHIPALSGSGVAYIVAKEILKHFKQPTASRQSPVAKLQQLTTYFQSDYLALATIGTIADLVPLIGPSRSIVYHGLKAFPKVKRVGIRHIIKESGIEDKEITPYEIGFIIAPRINAIGRLEHAIDALRLLCTHKDTQAKELASKVGSKNKERQALVSESVAQAKEIVAEMQKKNDTLPHLVILSRPDWNEGIIGLIASKIVEAQYRPTIVMTQSDGIWKGSARSIVGFDITSFLRLFQKKLLNVGGHPQAAGFSLSADYKDTFIKQATAKAQKLIPETILEKTIEVDLEIPLSKINLGLVKEIEKLMPFGIGNPQPLFLSKVEVLDKKLLGKKGEHVKLMGKDAEKSSFPMEFIAFNSAEEYRDITKGSIITIVFSPGINRWNGRESIQGRIKVLAKEDCLVPE